MKKSFVYQLVQLSVLNDSGLRDHEKIDILRVLFEQEDIERFSESRAEKESAAE